ncbi:MAG TPA: alkaline phosphatase family protein, partial [Solirubrobacter sp.]
QQVRRDVRPRIKRDWKYALVRSYATVIQLDLQVAAVTADVLAGRPVVYTTFLAYDEVAHHSGIERPDTLAVLRKVDQAIDRIAAAVEHAPRPYELIVLSDHGQSQGATFRQRYGEGLEDIVARFAPDGEVRAEDAHSDEGLASFNASVSEVATRDTPVGHAVRTAAGKRLEEPPDPSIPEVSVMASGNLGIISFPRETGRVTLEQITERRPGLLDALRGHPGIAFVLVRSEHLGPVVLGPAGQRFLNDDTVEGEDPLAPFGPFAADHVRRTDGFPHCPDIVVNSTYWDELEEVAAFEELVGSHGGMGGGQAHPFVLHPPELDWPSGPVVSSEAVHRVLRGWLAELGQTAYAEEREAVAR